MCNVSFQNRLLILLILFQELQQSVVSHKPLLDRFYKNVQALSELCDSEDEKQLEKIAEGLEERFIAARDAIQERAEALETAIEQNSQFSDRLDVILANLDGTATQVRLLKFQMFAHLH